MLELSIALGDTSTTSALKAAEVSIEGVSPRFAEITPIIAAFRRMVREVAYDLCELAPTTYLIAKAHGAPFTALPIVLMRRFHHHGLVKRPDAGIDTPKDLEGKKVGVRAYSVTTGVWTRGILQNDYGVDPDKVTWVVDDDEHVETMRLPQNVVRVAGNQSLAALMREGRISAGFTGNAGIGRAGSPTSGWNRSGIAEAVYPEVIADSAAAEAEWYGRTGVYPAHGIIVVRDEIIRANPWLATSLMDAFEASKKPQLESLARGDAANATDERYLKDMKVVGEDPLPFGFEAAAPSMEMLIEYAFQQRLIEHRPALEEVLLRVDE